MQLVSNPPNRYSKEEIEYFDLPPSAAVKVFVDSSATILSKNQSPDIPFTYSVNPYRGCFHACAYCYARPTHQYLDFGAGTDFETQLVMKPDAPVLLRREFMRRSWTGDPITFSGVTDCYQPLELRYELTRACLEVCLEFQNPVSIITKGAIIERDIDLLAELNRRAGVHVTVSVAFRDDEDSKLLEPGAPRPSRRFRTLAKLSEAGIPTGLALAPVIPGLNDGDIPNLISRGAQSGARSAFLTLLRLPREVAPVFEERLRMVFPTHAEKVLNRIREQRGGKLNSSQFGDRMRGRGQRWEATVWLFQEQCRRVGISPFGEEEIPVFHGRSFRRPGEKEQLVFDFI